MESCKATNSTVLYAVGPMLIQVKPEIGKGVLWYTHITPDEVEDVRSKHAGLMVQEGAKYLCTQWFGLPNDA